MVPLSHWVTFVIAAALLIALPGPSVLFVIGRTLALGRRAGLLRFELETAGTPIGPYDLLIASHALVLDLTLVTANAEEFGHFPGLSLEIWR